MTAKLIDDCFVLDKDRLPHHEALAILKSRVRTVVGTEEISLDEAAGRFLAGAIVSARPPPAPAHSGPRQCRGRRLCLHPSSLRPENHVKGLARRPSRLVASVQKCAAAG